MEQEGTNRKTIYSAFLTALAGRNGADNQAFEYTTICITRIFGRADARSGLRNNIHPIPDPPSPSPQTHNKPPFFIPVRGPPNNVRAPLKRHLQSHHAPSKSTDLPRAPRRDESMLNVNGSLLANPYSLGSGWFAGGDVEEDEEHSGNPKGGKG
ncbi:hypothetical protein HYDPIDRAFT_34008 [Hydnomerulius pinastri MD-312]|uniref:Uncharacterized protein n=1 Tax=Hydnomerulius pinastri MD-312 TaxID=994086 RepID=A0A0C9VLX4_9AGAM|nr:hypothetical protein HYDPIDRAFT_34008 [Hydnomerulius pinastri MD-312]